ncbi:imine reductase family protein [Amycolatopsis pigmentata]|uniref:NADPH-dependent reductive aminase-like C-terminal domain-containing protein n=1 Tax=Amycolatopsis pigmentata TaxID=450801 RepID=A0ABW5FLW9_9PSEU
MPGQQSLEFSDLSPIVRASTEQGVDPVTIAAVQALISREIANGHGAEGFARIYESLRTDNSATAPRKAGRAIN